MDKNQATKKGWLTAKLEDWEFRRSYERELVAELFVSRIEHAMSEQELTKTELSKRMECTLANVSRAMRKTTNMTIATMVDMGLALNYRVRIELEPLALEECAFPPRVKPAETSWSPLTERGDPMSEQGYMMCLAHAEEAANADADAASGGVSSSYRPWSSQSVYDDETPLPA